jgi:hypothetical protein
VRKKTRKDGEKEEVAVTATPTRRMWVHEVVI